MEPDTATVVAVVSVIIGGLGVLFGIYAHFRTHRVAKLTYEVSQLSDFDVPPSFLQDLPRAPVALKITSRGNKGTENIVLNLSARSEIEEYDVTPKGTDVRLEGHSISLNVAKLNPSQEVKLFLRCSGSPSENQIEGLDLSHSEGKAQNERALSNLVFDFFGLEIEYDLRQMRPYIHRIGPIRIRSTD